MALETRHIAATGRHRKVAVLAGCLAFGMLGLAYAAVPLYRMFCQATGYAGTTQKVTHASQTVLDRTVTVRFDANVAPGLTWNFAPVERTMSLRVGETGLAVFKATNTGSVAQTGTATFNVTPELFGSYFNKIECFCFTEQTIAPGATVELPVSFFVDPAYVNDKDIGHVGELTLSYSFYRVDKPKRQAEPRREPAVVKGT